MPELTASGFKAHIEAYLIQGNGYYATLYLLSLVGSREAVLAIHARLLKREPLLLGSDTSQAQYVRAGGVDYHLAQGRLPSGRHHALIYSRAILEKQILIARSEAELMTRHAQAWSAHCEVPIHPTWAAWLWQTAQRQQYLTALSTYRLQGCAVVFHPRMGQLIREAVLAGVLRVPTAKPQVLPLQPPPEVSDAA